MLEYHFTADGFRDPIAYDWALALAWYENRILVQPRVHVYLTDGDREVDVTGDFVDEIDARTERVEDAAMVAA